MNAPIKSLIDDAARRTAIMIHDRSFLVEAGAGSGKTAVMAGRIAMMLAQGISPKSIAAVTFTELAASELLMRVRDFVGALVAGRIPTELRVALPEGLSDAQRLEPRYVDVTIRRWQELSGKEAKAHVTGESFNARAKAVMEASHD